MIREIFIGYEPRQAEAFAVARASVRRHGGSKVIVRGLLLSDLMRLGWYTRPMHWKLGRLIDVLSATDEYDGTMSTEFANSRFFIPFVAAQPGWSIFMDCDVMVRSDLIELFDYLEENSDSAVACVKHNYHPAEHSKMDNCQQTDYFRKNWSSVMAFNIGHPLNEALTYELANTAPGRDLHRFCWLPDSAILKLPPEWNWLAQVSDESIVPKLVHWTLGGPWLPAFHDAPFADEWRWERDQWARDPDRVPRREYGPRVVFPPIIEADGEVKKVVGLSWLGGADR